MGALLVGGIFIFYFLIFNLGYHPYAGVRPRDNPSGKPLFVSNSLHKKWLKHIVNPNLIRYIIDIETTKKELTMNKTQIVYQVGGNDTRYAGLTLNPVSYTKLTLPTNREE